MAMACAALQSLGASAAQAPAARSQCPRGRCAAQALEKFKTQLTNTIERGASDDACVLRTRVTVEASVFGLQSASLTHFSCSRPLRR